MKERWQILPMKAMAALMLVLAFFPLFLLSGIHFLPGQELLWYLFPMCTLLWGVGGYFLPMKARVPFAIIGCIGLGAFGVLQGAQSGFGATIPFLLCIIVLILLPPAWARPVWEEWPLAYWVIGVLVHLAAQIFADRFGREELPMLLQVGFVVFILLLLIMMNRQGLRKSMHGGRKAPAAMRRRNLMLLMALFIPALLAACWGLLGEWLTKIWQAVTGFIGRIISWLASLLENEDMVFQENPGAQVMMDMGEAGEIAEKSLFAQIMEVVFIVVVILLGIAALSVLFWFLYKKLRILIRMIKKRLQKYAAAAGEDYVDEAESTLDLDEKAQLMKERFKRTFKRRRETPWNELDGRSRVRRLYKQYLQKKPQASGQTAREALEQDNHFTQDQAGAFIRLYERARYSQHEVSPEEADALRQKIKKIEVG